MSKIAYGTLFAISLALLNTANSAPLYYTFEGEINHLQDSFNIISDAGLAIGDQVSYTFLVDRDKDATRTYNNSDIYTYPDYPASDNFFVDVIDGSLIDEVANAFYGGANDVAEYNHGYVSTYSQAPIYSSLFGGSDNNCIRILNNIHFNDWTIGTSTVGTEAAMGLDSFDIASYRSSLTLVSISETYRVPEPLSLILLCTGLAGLSVIRRLG